MKYTDLLANWFDKELERAFKQSCPDNIKLLMGCAVWGEKYVKRFLQYGVPSLRAPGNIPALLDHGDTVCIVIHTDKNSISLFSEDENLAALEMLGVMIEVHIIPDEIISSTPDHPKNKYRLIGGAHNLHMKMAKYSRFAYHMLMPDHVYSENYFTGLRKYSKHDAIIHGGLSTTIEDAAPDLVSEYGVLAVESKKLNGIAWKSLHAMFSPYVMNGRDFEVDCPVCSHMLFSSDKYVHILSPHHSIAYLSHGALMRGPIRLFNTIDSQLPYFISESMSVYCPKPEDDMSYIEISDMAKDHSAPPPQDLLMFCLQFWLSNFCEIGFLRYFDMDNILALPDEYEHPIPPMKEKDIYKTKRKVRRAVRESRDKCMTAIKPEHQVDPIKDRAA